MDTNSTLTDMAFLVYMDYDESISVLYVTIERALSIAQCSKCATIYFKNKRYKFVDGEPYLSIVE